MRFIRSLIGWLSSLCLLASICVMFVAFPAYFTVYDLPEPNPSSAIQMIQELQTHQPLYYADYSGDILKKYVEERFTAKKDPHWIFNYLPWSDLGAWNEENMLPNKTAAALLDIHGRVVAAYPTELIGMKFPNVPANVPEDMPGSHYWRHEFMDAVGEYTSPGDYVRLDIIKPTYNDGDLCYLVTTYSSEQIVTSTDFTGEQITIGALVLFILYWLLLPVWVTLDANWRGMRPVAWGALVLLTNIIGLCAYLLARLGPPAPCPNCGEKVLGKYKRCPACGISLLKRCPSCRAKLKPGWQYCPICNWVASPQVNKAAETIWVPPPVTETAIDIAQTEDVPKSSITVNVFESVSGIPVSDANVVIAGPSTLEGTTRQDGSFEARKLLSGHYTITVSKQGYNFADMEIELGEQSSEIVQFELKLLSGEISGRVCDLDSKRLIAGAQVYIDSSRVDRSAVTDNEGGFLLTDVSAGPYTVCAEAEGFISQSKLVEVNPDKTAPVEFSLEHIQQTGELGESQ